MEKTTKLFWPAGSNPDVDGYLVEGGGTIRREDGVTPDGNPLRQQWVYRDAAGTLIDFDQYRNDIFERNNLDARPVR